MRAQYCTELLNASANSLYHTHTVMNNVEAQLDALTKRCAALEARCAFLELREGDTEPPELDLASLSVEAPPAEDGSVASAVHLRKMGNEIVVSSADDTALVGKTLLLTWPHDGQKYKCIVIGTKGGLHQVYYWSDETIETLSLKAVTWERISYDDLPGKDENPESRVGQRLYCLDSSFLAFVIKEDGSGSADVLCALGQDDGSAIRNWRGYTIVNMKLS